MENKALENKNEEIQSRREFFKDAAKKTLPILGAVMLANLPFGAKAVDKKEATDCLGGCDYDCYNTCSGRCGQNCSNSCLYGCMWKCSGSCKRESYYY